MAVVIQIRYEIPEPFIRLTGASIKYGSEPAAMPQKGSGSSSVVSCLCKFRSAWKPMHFLCWVWPSTQPSQPTLNGKTYS